MAKLLRPEKVRRLISGRYWRHSPVPAIGAAFHGFGARRQFRRHSERYRTMAGVLTQVQAEMREAATLEQVRKVAAETERVMREENGDLFGVMRFHDMELIT